jgi:hypothetical protein
MRQQPHPSTPPDDCTAPHLLLRHPLGQPALDVLDVHLERGRRLRRRGRSGQHVAGSARGARQATGEGAARLPRWAAPVAGSKVGAHSIAHKGARRCRARALRPHRVGGRAEDVVARHTPAAAAAELLAPRLAVCAPGPRPPQRSTPRLLPSCRSHSATAAMHICYYICIYVCRYTCYAGSRVARGAPPKAPARAPSSCMKSGSARRDTARRASRRLSSSSAARRAAYGSSPSSPSGCRGQSGTAKDGTAQGGDGPMGTCAWGAVEPLACCDGRSRSGGR